MLTSLISSGAQIVTKKIKHTRQFQSTVDLRVIKDRRYKDHHYIQGGRLQVVVALPAATYLLF